MYAQFNHLCSVIMVGSTAVFLGRAFSVCLNVQKHPEFYAAQSAPWYTSIVLDAIVTAVVLLAGLLIKQILRKKQRCK